MTAKSLKIAATATVFVAALSGLLYTTLSEGTEYFMGVDEVMAQPEAWEVGPGTPGIEATEES